MGTNPPGPRGVADGARIDHRGHQEAGIVRQVSAGKGNRLYEVREVFALLDEFETHPAAFRVRG